jgi:thiol-disulfide isomerase/thioredoxin
VFSFCQVWSQNRNEYVIPFKYKAQAIKEMYTTLEIIYINQIVDYSFLSGIPLDIPAFRIYSVTIDKLSNDLFYFYVGLDKSKDLKYLIVDSNINLDFSDDSLYQFSLDGYLIKPYTQEQHALCPEIQIEYKDTDQNAFLIDLAFNPFYADKNKNDYPSEDDYLLDFGVYTNSYLQGTFNLGKYNIVINEHKLGNATSLLPQEQLNEESSFSLFVQNDTISPKGFRVGDTTSVANRKIYLKGFRGNKLFLQDLGESPDSSKVGSYLPDLYSTCLSNSTTIHLNDLMKDKFVFIDFWGSWCAPCIASIPKVKELYDKIKERPDVLIIGIALDKEQDLSKLRKIVQDYNMDWLNVWDNYDKRQIVSSNYSKKTYIVFQHILLLMEQEKLYIKKKEK